MEKPLARMTAREIKSVVAKRYGEVAIDPKGKFNFPVGRRFAESVGYSRQLLDKAPSSLWESFTGAGNPQPYIDVTSGETVLDLGCGAGLDLYLYAQATGPEGRVYGLDLSEEMVAKAKHNMEMLNIENVEFQSEMIIEDEIDNDGINLIFSQNLRLVLPQKFVRRRDTHEESRIVNIFENPYWWITTTQENSNYIFKTFPPKKITTTFNKGVREKFCEISSDRILSVIKLDCISIPDDLNIFF